MEQLAVPRIVISGTGSGVGKSLLSIGLIYELRRRNHSVSCVTLGSRLAQATILKRLAGRAVRSLDGDLLNSSQMLVALRHAGVGADVVLIEGRRGLFDGENVGSFRGSDAEFAALSRSPVALVVDGRGFGQSVAGLIRGFQDLAGSSRNEGGFDLAGAILNRLGADPLQPVRDREFYNTALDAFQMPQVFGALPEFAHEAIFPQYQITQQKNNTLIPRQFLVELGRLVAQNVDVDRVLEAAEMAPAVSLPEFTYAPLGRRCRIAVSDDSCFNLSFQDNLEWLRYYGAEVVPFSPIADSSLPNKVGAVYLTGGYLAEYGRELERNTDMLLALQDFAERGGVIYSEGAGSAYLCQEFSCEGMDRPVSGVGILPCIAQSDRAGYSYIDAVTIEDCVLGRPGMIVKGVTTGEWKTSKDDRLVRTLRLSRGSGKPSFLEGFSPGAQIISTFSFFHFGSNPKFAQNLADAAEVVEALGGGNEIG